MNELIDFFINNCNNIFIDKEIDKINRLELGYIKSDKAINTFSILVHCIENINIFDNNQKNNIRELINELTYE